MARALAATLLAFALLAMTALPALADAEAGARSAPDVVTIDAAGDELLTEPVLPGTNVTVRVTNVPAGANGFTLADSLGPVFENQTSRHDGVVAFWDVPATPGTYTVNRSTPTGNETLAAVEIVEGSGAGPCENPLREGCSTQAHWCFGGDRTTSEKLAEETHWTPVIAVNSPSDGRATASASWTETTAVFVSPGTWVSEIEHSETIEAEDGEARGFYRLAKWGIYERTTHHCWGGQTTTREAKVIDWQPNGYKDEVSIDLTSDSRYTDQDNFIKAGADGESTLTHDLRYKTVDRDRSGESRRSIQSKQITGIAGGVSAGTHHVSFDLISFERTEEEGLSFTYHFEDPDGNWYVDELQDSPGWAFCRPSQHDCRSDR